MPTPRSPLAPKCPHVISFYDAYTDAHSDSVSMVLEYMNAGTLQVSVKYLGFPSSGWTHVDMSLCHKGGIVRRECPWCSST